MARSINEGDLVLRPISNKCKRPYLLGDLPELLLSPMRVPKRVKQCSFSMINMSHYSNNWSPNTLGALISVLLVLIT